MFFSRKRNQVVTTWLGGTYATPRVWAGVPYGRSGAPLRNGDAEEVLRSWVRAKREQKAHAGQPPLDPLQMQKVRLLRDARLAWFSRRVCAVGW